MFLLVFVTLMISIVDLYAHVISVQAHRIYEKQHTLADTMATWHAAAITAANTIPAANLPVATPCWLQMPGMLAVASPEMPYAACVGATTGLPSTYNIADYSFYTVMFNAGTTTPDYYVLTFAYDVSSSAYSYNDLVLPGAGGALAGYTLHDLDVQFGRTGSAQVNRIIGNVTTSTGASSITGVFTPLTVGGASVYAFTTFAIPGTIPTGAFGIITPVQ